MDSSEVAKNKKSITPFRIFLASPGDVPMERKLVREAISYVNSERRFRGRVHIEIVAWDQPGAEVAMEAPLTPQEAIALGLREPIDCDLAVIVLWSRIGTPLPDDYERKPNGKRYLSGTEWEYHNAMKGYQDQGKPGVWVYRRRQVSSPALDDPGYDAIMCHRKKLQSFFSAFYNKDGSLAGGVNKYESPDQFHRKFEGHLRDRLERFLQSLTPQSDNQTKPKRCWRGSPYPGLAAFTPEQAPIFFGRGLEIDQLFDQITNPSVRFVAVVGVSGSGKSSLVMGGLLPQLRDGTVGHAPRLDVVFRPAERDGNPFLAAATALKGQPGIPDHTEEELARALRVEPKEILDRMSKKVEACPKGSRFC